MAAALSVSAQKIVQAGVGVREKREHFLGFTEDAEGNLFGISTSYFEEKQGESVWLWKFGRGGTAPVKTKLNFTTAPMSAVWMVDNGAGAFILAYSKTLDRVSIPVRSRKVSYGVVRITTKGEIKEKLLGDVNSWDLVSGNLYNVAEYGLSSGSTVLWAASPDHQKILVSAIFGKVPQHKIFVLDANLNIISSQEQAPLADAAKVDFSQQGAQINDAGDVTVFFRNFKNDDKNLYVHYFPKGGKGQLFSLGSDAVHFFKAAVVEGDGLNVLAWGDIPKTKNQQKLEFFKLQSGKLVSAASIDASDLWVSSLDPNFQNPIGWALKTPVRINVFTMPGGTQYIVHTAASMGAETAAWLDFLAIEVKDGAVTQYSTVPRRLGNEFIDDGGVYCFSNGGKNYMLYMTRENREGMVAGGGNAGFLYLQDLADIKKLAGTQIAGTEKRNFDLNSCYSLQTGGIFFPEFTTKEFLFQRLEF